MTLSRRSTGLHGRDYSVALLLGLVTLASILPLLLLGIFGLTQYVAQQQTDLRNRMSRYAATLTNAVDRELRGHMDIAQVVAASRYLMNRDLEAFGVVARDAASKARGHFVLIDRSGQQLVNTRLPVDAGLPLTEDMGSLREVIETGKPAVGDLFVGAVSKRLLFVVRVPVVVDGEVRYVLSFEPESGVIRNLVQQTYVPEGWFAAVLDTSGRIVTRSFRHESFYGKQASSGFLERLIGREGFIDSRDLEGREVLTKYQRSALADWRILLWAPTSVLNKPLHDSVMLAVGLAVFTVLASLAAGFLSGRIVAEPIRQLQMTARALGAGKPAQFESTHMREANVVGHSLAEAARSIASREQALRKSELHTRFIMRELSHRSKNLLAVIQAIARQTSRTAHGVDEFNDRLGERLASLGRSQDLLVHKNWQGVSLAELIGAQLKAFVDVSERRVATSGPPLLLNAEAAQNIGMALHELATNASKHGALSVPSGRVSIAWEWYNADEGERRLRLRWTESGGPAVKAPERKGFGHSVIERLAAASLHGTAELDWRPEGLVWSFEVPECSIVEGLREPPDDLPDRVPPAC